MAAMFREVAAYSGVDEKLPTKGQGIVIPSLTSNPGASTLVILEGGNGLTVQSTLPAQVHVYEFKTKQERADATRNATNPSDAIRRLEAGSLRIFSIKGDAPVGIDKVKVEAKNNANNVEATLKVIVLNEKGNYSSNYGHPEAPDPGSPAANLLPFNSVQPITAIDIVLLEWCNCHASVIWQHAHFRANGKRIPG